MKCNDENTNCKFKDRYGVCEILNDTIFKDGTGVKRKCPFYKELKHDTKTLENNIKIFN